VIAPVLAFKVDEFSAGGKRAKGYTPDSGIILIREDMHGVQTGREVVDTAGKEADYVDWQGGNCDRRGAWHW
jgi:hypothetical protein